MAEDSKTTQLGSAPIGGLMVKLALPSIAAQLINILYNIVDRVYIGHIPEAGSLALTGLGVCFPILTLISAFSAFAGSGGGPLAAIELGKAEHDPEAKKRGHEILGNAFFMIICFSIILTVGFSIFKKPLLMAFGASSNTLPYANDYLTIYLVGTFFVQIAIGLNPFITAQGHARTAMFSVLIGAIANIILDPIFIFGFNMGVKGAAIATVISQGLSAAWVLWFLCSKKSSLRLTPKIVRFKARVAGKISALGVAPFIMQATESAIIVVFNAGLQKYGGALGDLYVGSMTIMQSLMQMTFVPLQGFTYGVQPIISYNYGARNFDRVRTTIKRMVLVSFIGSVVMGIVVPAFPRTFGLMFTNSEDMLTLIGKVLPIYFGAVWIFGLQVGAQSTFLALGRSKMSLFIALLRKVILLIPLALILPNFFGVMGIYYSEPIASTTSAITATILLIICYKKLRKEELAGKTAGNTSSNNIEEK